MHASRQSAGLPILSSSLMLKSIGQANMPTSPTVSGTGAEAFGLRSGLGEPLLNTSQYLQNALSVLEDEDTYAPGLVYVSLKGFSKNPSLVDA